MKPQHLVLAAVINYGRIAFLCCTEIWSGLGTHSGKHGESKEISISILVILNAAVCRQTGSNDIYLLENAKAIGAGLVPST